MPDLATLTVEVRDDGILLTTASLKKFTTAAEGAAKGTEKVEKANKKLAASNVKTKQSILDMSSSFKIAGRDLSRFITLPLLAAGAASFKMGSDLNEGLGLVESLLPPTIGRIEDLSDAVKDLAVASGKGFDDLTEGLYQTISAFQDGEDTIDRFNTVTKAAVAGNSSVRGSLELLSAVTKGYDDTTAEAIDRVSDLAFEAIRLGQTTFPELAASIQKVTSLSSTMAVSQEELFTVFATLTGVTGDAAEVSTQFSSALAALLTPSADLTRLLAKLGLESGKALIEQRGLIGAFKAMATTADASGISLFKFTKRKEALKLVTALTTAQEDDFAAKLEQVTDSVGAQDRAFQAVTGGINKFGFQLKQAKERLAVVGAEAYDVFIPALTTMVTNIANLISGFTNLSPVLQNIVIGLLTLTATFGPALIAFGSVIRLVKLATTLFAGYAFVLGPVGAILASITVATVLYARAQGKAVEEQEAFISSLSDLNSDVAFRNKQLLTLTDSYKGMTDAQGVNKTLNRELIEQYPYLSGVIDVSTTKVNELQAAFNDLNAQAALKEAPDIYSAQIEKSKELGDSLRASEEELNLYRESVKIFEASIKEGLDAGEDVEPLRDELALIEEDVLRVGQDFQFFKTAIEDIATKVDLTANATGIDAYFSKWGIGFRKLVVDGDEAADGLEGVAEKVIVLGDDAKTKGLKSWQEWFEDVTGVVTSRFSTLKQTFASVGGELISTEFLGKNQGEKAGLAFIDDLRKTFENKVILTNILGGEADIEKGFETMIKAGEGAILELIAIKEEAIAGGEVFLFADQSIKTIIESVKEYKNTLTDLQNLNFLQDIQDEVLGLDKLNISLGNATNGVDALEDKVGIYESALSKAQETEGISARTIRTITDALHEAQAAFDGASEKALTWQDILSQAKGETLSFSEVLQSNLAEALFDTGLFTIQASIALADMADQMVNMGIDAVASAFEGLGRAFADGAASGDELLDIMADQARAILQLLPQMFLQAGLSLIANGSIGLGLGFIAAGLSASFLSGFVSQKEEDASANATGNAFSGGNVVPFAIGGAFTNSIVDTVTPFQFGGQLGVMGEKGAEAIMPLTRTSSGNLGVETSGSGGGVNVIVKITNNTGSDVSTQENDTPEGKEIEIIIGQVVSKQLSTGKFDKSMSGRYGTKVVGINN